MCRVFWAEVCGEENLVYFCGTFWFAGRGYGDARCQAMRLKGNQVRDLNRPATVIPKKRIASLSLLWVMVCDMCFINRDATVAACGGKALVRG